MNAKLLYNTANQTGLSDVQARQFMTKSWSTLTNEQFIAMGDMPFGPNELSFREQYPADWQAAVTERNTYIEAGRDAERFALDSAEEEAILDFDTTMAQDLLDGSFDANPVTLAEAADELESKGLPKAAENIRKKIPLTASAQYDSKFLSDLQSDLDVGISNYSVSQILSNPSLSTKAKREAVAKINSFNETAVPQDVKTTDKGILDSYIDNRGKVNTFQKGPAHPSVKIMKDKAWSRYSQVFSQTMAKTGGDVAASRQAAKQDFMAEFGTDDTKGEYAVKPALSGASSGQYVNGTITGKAFSSDNYINKVEETFQSKGTQRALSEPDLYPQEKEELTTMLQGVGTGKITVPPTFYAIAKQSGGKMSVRQLLNQRLKANKLDELPKDIGQLAEQVERSFDPSYNKFLNYMPSFTRTDIAAIGSGMEPIYTPSIPANVKDDAPFQQEVSAVAGRLGVSEADLYAVMSFETGGSFSPSQKNMAGSGATGLIQFMPSTAEGLGTSTQALSGMSRVQQMQFVETYLKNAGVKPGMQLSDLYMAVLFPAAVGKSDDYVLFGNGAMSGYGGVAYDQNSGLDKNGDGSITKGEAAVKVLGHRNPWRQPRNVRPELVQ